ncbi:MAG: ATP-dependent Clp protease proteolytic subunit, partial [Parvularcula sp.]|nr:ATP-dependent Clp protease proteolytic subunit [Parvularcula sp.]
MLRLRAVIAWALVIVGVLGLVFAQSESRTVTVLSLEGAVTPTSANYLKREIANADIRGDELVMIEIDTPGGLVNSMQTIVQTILAAETPVVTYVAPQGARSASAGLYIMYAAHVSAMAPATNTGSATPVGGGSPFSGDEESAEGEDISNQASMRGKVIEDAVAYIRGLAQLRGRNGDWAEKAVRP